MPPPITRRNSVEGIADMNEFARTVVITTLQSEGGSCPLWKLAETADHFQCDNLVQALRSMKNKKQVAYAPPMLMLEMHKMEIVTLVSDGAEEDEPEVQPVEPLANPVKRIARAPCPALLTEWQLEQDDIMPRGPGYEDKTIIQED